MAKIYVKIRERIKGNKYRIFTDSNNRLYKNKDEIVAETLPYNPETLLEKGGWYYIEKFSEKDYFLKDLLKEFNSIDCETMSSDEYNKIDFLFEENSNIFYFQNIGKTKLIKKKGLIRFGSDFGYYDDYSAISINEYPDAVYDKNEDKLYFRELSSITGIFQGIDVLFKVATEEETKNFLKQDFIELRDDFTFEKVKTSNRKRITFANEVLSKMEDDKKKDIIKYIGNYCPNIKKDDNTFNIKNDEELTMLLYGIEERFYTTYVGNEKRIANSVIKMQE